MVGPCAIAVCGAISQTLWRYEANAGLGKAIAFRDEPSDSNRIDMARDAAESLGRLPPSAAATVGAYDA